ncbi:methylated-DNA--[protein]-cysteine S-methyltransferase [Haloechinothrix sp. YIM 98757]|uniref:Methylated-DNA--[protein]-cysteine S-methyltransferase n=1 Tax=Haloechinothrix aidingensis TaxID=2752311 RepID=A0A838A6D3_9PSEU|nr:methylated-DNA--[protein]-cysteine S-methyltransferase [Haloechinothrix aidingensis]MBA0125400.1 methylated-DNA--[protein]-cysteine S-methyltransferase [Haloechinothrix aidingensis]
MTLAYWATTETPAGPFTAIVAPDGAVLASGWTLEPDDLTARIAGSLLPGELRARHDLGPVTRAVRAYHAGELDAIDEIVVRQRSGDFLQKAWATLRDVPAGQPVSYSELATRAGRRPAVRAAAMACARNAAALFVPCHRVLRTGGSLGGFRWGVDVKRWLLEHERRNAATSHALQPQG